ncbi:MAG TPA: sugar transferase [Acidimicrobiales bacterium]|nr:sugar transferase [Acidimicrobiales bacterium]
MKRVIDVVAGTILVVVTLPLVLALAGASAVVLRAWPFFLHERVGYRGRRFRVPKIRTLPPTVSATVNKYHVAKLDLPRFARFLRRSHLDELPQLLLVPIGRMSLVGPRPEMPRLHDDGDPRFASMRVLKRPGCTGLWQIGRDANRLIWEAPEYDLFYVNHASVRLDLWILWRTALQFAAAAEPAALHQVPAWAMRKDVQSQDAVWLDSVGSEEGAISLNTRSA